MPVNFGVLYEARNPKQFFLPWDRFYASMLEHIKAMDQMGYGSVAFTEHHFDPDGHIPSPLVWCAVSAGITKRARIGQDLFLLPHANPVRVAEDLATMDVISGGRIFFHGGEGYRPHEFTGLGTPLKQRASRSEEAMIIIRKCLTEENFSHSGRYWQLENVRVMPRPLQKPLPMFLAANNTGVPMERAINLGFHAITNHMSNYDLTPVAEWHKAFLAKCREMGKNPKDYMFSDIIIVYPTDDPEKAWRKHRMGILQVNNAYRQQGGRGQPLLETPEQIPGWQSIFQTPDNLVRFLRQRFSEATPDYLFFWSFRPSMPPEESLEYHETLTKKVLPKLKDLRPWRERPGG